MNVDLPEELALHVIHVESNETDVAESEAGGAAIRAAQQAGEAAAVAAAAASRVTEATELRSFLERSFQVMHGWGGEALEPWGVADPKIGVASPVVGPGWGESEPAWGEALPAWDTHPTWVDESGWEESEEMETSANIDEKYGCELCGGPKMWFNRCCSDSCQRRWRAKNRDKEALCYFPGFSPAPGFEARKYPRASAVDKGVLMERVETTRGSRVAMESAKGNVHM